MDKYNWIKFKQLYTLLKVYKSKIMSIIFLIDNGKEIKRHLIKYKNMLKNIEINSLE